MNIWIYGHSQACRVLIFGGGADRGPEEILAHPGETVEGKERVDMGVGQPSFDVRAVLERSGRFRRKGSLDRFLAAGTAPKGTAVFGRHQPLGRKIENLSGGDGQVGVLFERPGISAGAPLRVMDDNPVRHSTGERVCPGCPFCPPGFLSVGGCRLLGCGLPKPSDYGGLINFRLFFAIWASRVLTRARRSWTWACRARMMSTRTRGFVCAIASSSSRVKIRRGGAEDPGVNES